MAKRRICVATVAVGRRRRRRGGGDSSELSVQVSFDSEVSVARGGGGGGDYSRVPMTAFDGEGTHIPNSSGDYRRHHGAVSRCVYESRLFYIYC
eukprot:COSAG06_NODE_2671_length_6467_cov_46.974560_8_plen_94_part_00